MSSFRSTGLDRFLDKTLAEPVEPVEPYPPLPTVAERRNRADFYGQVYNPSNFRPAPKR